MKKKITLNRAYIVSFLLIISVFAHAQTPEFCFLDDFSKNSIIKDTVIEKEVDLIFPNGRSVYDTTLTHVTDINIPDTLKWEVSDVLVSDNYPIKPPTIGVATFDATNKLGVLYQSSDAFYFADTLTSKKCDISGYNISDSVYMSFFFQPQGLGDKPEERDSLIVQFYNSTDDRWVTVCKVSPTKEETIVVERIGSDGNWKNYTVKYDYKVFNEVFIPITNSNYLKSDFRFRIMNMVDIDFDAKSFVSNADHWNVDYVRLGRYRRLNEKSLNDLAFSEKLKPLLEEYYSVPWAHFDASLFKAKSEYSVVYKNNSNESKSSVRYFEFRDLDDPTNSRVIESGVTTFSPDQSTDFSIKILRSDYFNKSGSSDIARFKVLSYLRSNADDPVSNDTVSYIQTFENFYAYDDGTAEEGYGFKGDNSDNAKMAYMFRTVKEDKISRIDIYFNNSLKNDVSFNLYIWGNKNGLPDEDQELHHSYEIKPSDPNKLNKYYPITLDNPVMVKDTFFIGIGSVSSDYLNIGLDKNNKIKSKLFINKNYVKWEESDIENAVMIRPIIGPVYWTPVDDKKKKEITRLKIYPNPVESELNFEVSDEKGVNVVIYNSSGMVVKQHLYYFDRVLNLDHLKEGVYIIAVESGNKIYTNKFIKK